MSKGDVEHTGGFVMPSMEALQKEAVERTAEEKREIAAAVAKASPVVAARIISRTVVFAVIAVSGIAVVLAIAITEIDWFYPVVLLGLVAYFAWEGFFAGEDDLPEVRKDSATLTTKPAS